jgi:ATP-binding cassette subfamily C protein
MAQKPLSKGEGELAGVVRASRDLIGWAALFSAGLNLLYLAPSLYMLQIYDRVLSTGGLVTLAYCTLILIFALGTLAVLDALRARLLVRMSARVERLMSRRVLEAISARPDHANSPQGRQALRSFDTLRQTLTGPATTAALDAPWAPVYVIVCFMLHPFIGLAVVLGGAILVAVAIRNDQVMRGHIQAAAELAPQMYAATEIEAQAGGVMRSLGMRGALIDRQIDRRALLNEKQAYAAFTTSFYSSLTRFMRLLLQSLVLGIGAWLAVDRQITPGAMIAGSILATRALAPLEQIVGAWRQLGEAKNAYRAVGALLTAIPADKDRTALPAPTGRLMLERVGAVAGQRPVLQQVSFTLSPGEILCVIGPSGAGKSTLARLVAGAAQPDAGIVRLDGANIADWDPDLLGKHVGYLPQEIALLAGSIGDNIRRLQPKGGGDALVIEAAKAAGVHDMILKLPGGYDAELSLGGVGLSAGQSQRVALARALYGSPALLVLDEPNSHLDQDGEVALVGALKAAKARGAAILMVAHRSSVVSIADRLLVLKDGRIEMLGPREQVTEQLNAAAKGAAPIVPVRKQVQP